MFVTSRAEHNEAGDYDQFTAKGGMTAMSAVLDQGMVLVLSLWDDSKTRMLWLDSVSPLSRPASEPGIQRGQCDVTTGEPQEMEMTNANAFVTYSNIRIGEIGSTSGGLPPVSPAAPAAPLYEMPPAAPAYEYEMPPAAALYDSPPPPPELAVPAAVPAAGGCAGIWDRCGGGPDYGGPICCEAGCFCDPDTTGYYAQCKPPVPSAWTCTGQAPQRLDALTDNVHETTSGLARSPMLWPMGLAAVFLFVAAAAVVVSACKRAHRSPRGLLYMPQE